ncbi:uncharacterized protein LOC132062382 [Lycium ferocissimum]|uniref:uncharacterized protein LOC132062382 n=1 Tax=Lycium ferocissimum TaxID=112874 RepID=UPI0028160337|nr:uncharacterized protein LOC132062382 [Lycium ferocissimum]
MMSDIQKKITDQQKLIADNQNRNLAVRNLENQMGQIVGAQNSRPPGGLPKEVAPKKTSRVEAEKEKIAEEMIEKERVVETPVVHVNIPLVDMLHGIPKYAQYIKDIVANKSQFTEYATVSLTEECTSRIQNRLPTKLKDPGSFTIEISIGKQVVARALCDLGAAINLMPSSIFRKLGLGVPRPTTIVLQLVERSLERPKGIIEDVFVQVGSFIIPADLVILDFELEPKVPFILGHPFLATGRTLIDVAAGQLTMRVHDKVEVFNVYKALKMLGIYEELLAITVMNDDTRRPLITSHDPLEKALVGDDIFGDLAAFVMVQILAMASIYIREGDEGNTLLVILATELTAEEVSVCLEVLKSHKRALRWQISDIQGISPALCMHKILMEDDHNLQRSTKVDRTVMKEVIKKEVIKWLDSSIIFPISDSKWDSSVQCVPKKGGMTAVTNEKNTLIPTRTITGWRICMDYRKLNEATRKDHYPIPFIDQMLDRLLEKKMKFLFNDACIKAFKGLKKILVIAQIIIAPDWNLPFELMCDASDNAVGAVLVQRREKVFHSLYYASKMLNAAQINYTVTEKEYASCGVRF